MKSKISRLRYRAMVVLILLPFLLLSGLHTGHVPLARAQEGVAAKPAVEPLDTVTLEQPQVRLAEEQTSSNVVVSEPTAVNTLPVQASNTVSSQTAELPAPDVVLEMIGEVNQDRVLTDLRRLTGEEPICINSGCHTITDRATGSEGLGWAKSYIYKELSGLGYSVESFGWSLTGYADQDLIVRKTGTSLPNEEIYFVAHIDGVKRLGGSQFPAADDNASGVVDLLELARVLSVHSFNRTVVLLFSTGEETGLQGVRSYIDQLTQAELDSIQYVVNVDMVGYDGDRDGAMQLWSGDHPPSLALAQILSEVVKAHQLALLPSVITGCT